MYLSVFAICSKEKADFNNFEKLIFLQSFSLC